MTITLELTQAEAEELKRDCHRHQLNSSGMIDRQVVALLSVSTTKKINRACRIAIDRENRARRERRTA